MRISDSVSIGAAALKRTRHGSGLPTGDRALTRAARNLVLTEGARADSVPNLEIETGEIAGAGHSSTTGRFDDEHLFYLTSRGIDPVEAKRLVVMGFFVDIIRRIGVPVIEDHLRDAVEAELAKAVNDAAIEEGRQQMINELKFDLDLLKHHNEKMGPEIEKLKRRHASISRHTAMLSKVLDGLFRGLKA